VTDTVGDGVGEGSAEALGEAVESGVSEGGADGVAVGEAVGLKEAVGEAPGGLKSMVSLGRTAELLSLVLKLFVVRDALSLPMRIQPKLLAGESTHSCKSATIAGLDQL
jgi:hypothetical protein